MSRITVSKATGMPNVEPGVYFATCTGVKDDTIENPQFGNGDIVRIYLRLDDMVAEDGEPVVLDGMANRIISPKSKLTRWAEALGRPINFDEEDDFETEDLVEGRCQVKVTRENKDSWPKVDDLTALPRGMANQPTVDDTIAFLKVDAKGEAAVDWTIFWTVVKRHGLNKTHIINAAEGKEPEDIDPFELPQILEALIGKTKVPV